MNRTLHLKLIKFFSFLLVVLFSCFSLFYTRAFAKDASWTVLVYMAGQNNLSAACVEDVLEMLEVGSTDQVNILVQADVSSIYTPEIPDNVTYRFKVLDHDLQLFPMERNQDMAAPATLTDFIKWGVSTFPAQRYALILWDHGLGWLGGFEGGRNGRGILQDDGSNSFMSLEELRRALDEAGIHFDLLEFDACLMGQIEVLGYVYEFADYITFSENTEPGDGNPYDVIFYVLVHDPEMGGEALGRLIVDSFVDYYSRPPNNLASVTKSLVRTEGVAQLLVLVDRFGGVLKKNMANYINAIYEARTRAQTFPAMPGACDCIDFIEKLRLNGVSFKEANELADWLKEQVIVKERHYSSAYSFGTGVGAESVEGSRGIAMNIPLPGDLLSGERVQYAQISLDLGISQWNDFIEAFLHETEGISPETAKGGFVIQAYWTDVFGNPSGADLDLYIVEPQDVFAPWMGQTTPNGFFSPDSKDSGKSYEIYIARDEISKGIYIPVINFYDSWMSLYQGAYCYLQYFPKESLTSPVVFGPQAMGLWNPAPTYWDDEVIYLLSINFYSDWWIPTSFEQKLSRAPIEFQRAFWMRVRELKEKAIAQRLGNYQCLEKNSIQAQALKQRKKMPSGHGVHFQKAGRR